LAGDGIKGADAATVYSKVKSDPILSTRVRQDKLLWEIRHPTAGEMAQRKSLVEPTFKFDSREFESEYIERLTHPSPFALPIFVLQQLEYFIKMSELRAVKSRTYSEEAQ